MNREKPIEIHKSDYNPGDIVIPASEIADRIHSIALNIVQKYQREFILVSVLKGACMLSADFQRALFIAGNHKFCTSFVTVKSYSSGTESSKNPHLVQDIDFDPQDKDILLLDDIIDTGISLRFLHHIMTERGARSVHSFALLSKPERREVAYEADYVGFIIPNMWVEGYGMDSNEYGRGNPNIIVGPLYG